MKKRLSQINQKRLDQVRNQILNETGLSLKEFAEMNGFTFNTLHAIFYGKTKCTRGEAYRTAVRLGIIPKPNKKIIFVDF